MATVAEITAALEEELPDNRPIQHVTKAGQKYVFKAQHKGESIAVKAILIGVEPETAQSQDEVEDTAELEEADEISESAARLQREIEILRKCQTKHIVALAQPQFFELTVGQERFGVYAEHWIDGKDLRELFNSRRLTRTEAIDLGCALCDALAELDKHGYVHRDIKPQNIMLQRDGTFLLVDPGMALDRAGPSLTVTGNILGTIEYISPEQWDPQRKRDLDVRSDMFALGIVLFQGLTNTHPFLEPGMTYIDVMTAARSTNRHELTGANLGEEDHLRVIIARLLSPKVHGRYRNTAALREAFEAAR